MLFRIFLLFFVVKSLLFAETRLFECNKIFEERKNELILELERLNDKEASLQALTEETNKLLKMKKAKLDKQEAEINQKLDMISEKENRIEEMLNENKKLLSEIEKLKMTKDHDKIEELFSFYENIAINPFIFTFFISI